MKILDDHELEALSDKELIGAYKSLRDAMEKKDRSTILRMAGNIASGMNRTITDKEELKLFAKHVVMAARAIVTEVDR